MANSQQKETLNQQHLHIEQRTTCPRLLGEIDALLEVAKVTLDIGISAVKE